jgi:hypothetical protein
MDDLSLKGIAQKCSQELKNSSSNENHQIGEISTGLEWQVHQEKSHKVLMCDSHIKSHKETPPKLRHENPNKRF